MARFGWENHVSCPQQANVRPALEGYVAGLVGYRTNGLSLDEPTKAMVADRWQVAFEAFGHRP